MGVVAHTRTHTHIYLGIVVVAMPVVARVTPCAVHATLPMALKLRRMTSPSYNPRTVRVLRMLGAVDQPRTRVGVIGVVAMVMVVKGAFGVMAVAGAGAIWVVVAMVTAAAIWVVVAMVMVLVLARVLVVVLALWLGLPTPTPTPSTGRGGGAHGATLRLRLP